MGIVVHCPNGHRLKVKDEFAGRKVLCPTCQATIRVSLGSTTVEPAAAGAAPAPAPGLPTARLLTLAPAALAQLPRAHPFSIAPSPAQLPAFAPEPAPEPEVDFAAPPAEAPAVLSAFMPTLHPALAEMPDLHWRIAYPGGEPSEPASAESMQAWLDAGQADGSELVWRSDWPEWLPAREVFPDRFA